MNRSGLKCLDDIMMLHEQTIEERKKVNPTVILVQDTNRVRQ